MERSNQRLSGAAKWFLILGLLLVANSAYLAAFGDPTLFYVANALLHPLLGIIAGVFLVGLIVRYRALLAGAVGALTGLFLTLAAAFGIYLLFVGMTRPHSLALYVHVGAAIAGLFLLLVVLHARARGSGAPHADIDNDDAPDILLTTNGGPAYLFHNVGGSRSNAIRIKTVGTRSNRDGIGAEVRVRSRAGENWQTVHSGSSYCSQSELTLTFGLGQDAEAQAVEILWPSGQHDTLKNLKANSTYTIQEGGRILSTRPFKR
jgi:hypothetical protein